MSPTRLTLAALILISPLGGAMDSAFANEMAKETAEVQAPTTVMKTKAKSATLPGLTLPADPASARLGFKRDPVLKSPRTNTSMKSTSSRTSIPVKASAASTLKASAPSGEARTLGQIVKGKLRVGLAMSRADAMNGANVDQGGETIGTVNFNASSQPGLDLRWSSLLYRGQGAQAAYNTNYFVGLTLERERQLGSAEFRANDGAATQSLTFNADIPTYQANILSAGIEWKLSPMISLPVGLTLPMFTRTSIRNGVFDLGPRAGWMLGVNLAVNPNAEIEVAYRAVNYAMSLKEFQLANTQIGGAVQMHGLNLGIRYIF